jgi:hypothetical protein
MSSRNIGLRSLAGVVGACHTRGKSLASASTLAFCSGVATRASWRTNSAACFLRSAKCSSYGFRPGRSAHQALEEIRGHLQAGYQAVYEAGLKGYFDSIPHSQTQLMACLRMRVVDRAVLTLIRMWLEAPIVERSKGQGGGSQWSRPKQGTPQGGVATPRTQKITWVRP